MAQLPEDNGVCSISPSDMMGQIDNILTRLERLEETVAQLAAADIGAIQLSDISASAGWIYDVTYMGTAGWTQTPAGTLIPPLGFTVSEILANAQANQLAAYASSGILGTSGLTTALFQISTGSLATGPSETTFTFTTVEGQSFITNNSTSLTRASGLYLFTVNDSAGLARTATTNASVFQMRVGSPISGNQNIGFGGIFASDESTITRYHFNGALVARFPDDLSGTTITGTGSKTGSVSVTASPLMYGISKLAS
jgi:hypothetical protein